MYYRLQCPFVSEEVGQVKVKLTRNVGGPGRPSAIILSISLLSMHLQYLLCLAAQ